MVSLESGLVLFTYRQLTYLDLISSSEPNHLPPSHLVALEDATTMPPCPVPPKYQTQQSCEV